MGVTEKDEEDGGQELADPDQVGAGESSAASFPIEIVRENASRF